MLTRKIRRESCLLAIVGLDNNCKKLNVLVAKFSNGTIVRYPNESIIQGINGVGGYESEF
jgi:hypothetical protein